MHSFKHTFIHALMHTFIHKFKHTSMHTFIHTFMHTFIHTSIHTFMHKFQYECIHYFASSSSQYLPRSFLLPWPQSLFSPPHTHTHTHAHTHTHTHTASLCCVVPGVQMKLFHHSAPNTVHYKVCDFGAGRGTAHITLQVLPRSVG